MQSDGSAARQVPSLTGLRGIAALWVVLFHVDAMGGLLGLSFQVPGERFIANGWAGVDLFFVLSGFMLMNAHTDQFKKVTWSTLRHFAISRFMRIYPLSSAALVLILALVLCDTELRRFYTTLATGNLSPRAFLATLLLATRWLPRVGDWNEPTWSLSVELVGYVAFPLLAWSASRVSTASAAGACAVGVTLLFISGQALDGQLGLNQFDDPAALARMFCFFSGGVLARQAASLVRNVSERGVRMGAWATAIAIAVLGSGHRSSGLLPLAFGALIFLLFLGGNGGARLLDSGPAMFLGRVSFPLYLLHVMPLFAFTVYAKRHGAGRAEYLMGSAAVVVALLALSEVAHRFIEVPSHRAAKRWLSASGPMRRLPAST